MGFLVASRRLLIASTIREELDETILTSNMYTDRVLKRKKPETVDSQSQWSGLSHEVIIVAYGHIN